VSRSAAPPLTHRELQVLKLLAGGLSNGEIANRLTISVNTVASHIKHLYPKIKVNSRAAAVAYAMSQGIQPPAH
jgi:ATP/maltotriose-dependent transcriptional regulator MalT